jgi:hypothetical protein
MLSDSDLQSRAVAVARAWTRSMLEGEYDVVPETPENEWDPTLRRYVSVQPMVIWRAFDQVRITVGPDGQVMSFLDRNRFSHATYRRLGDDEILRICRTTGVLGPSAVVTQAQQGSREMLVVEIVEQFPERLRRLSFIINPASRQVAAFQILEP